MTDVLRQAWEAAFRHVRPLLDANLPLAFGVVALWTTIGLVCGGVLGAGVFVAKTRRYLKIAVEPGHHEQLLELLRRLWKRVKLTRMKARRHEEIARAFG